MSTPEQLLARGSWRLRHSWWIFTGVLLFLLVGVNAAFPLGWGFLFAYVAWRMREVTLGAIAAAYLVAFVAVLVLTLTVVDMTPGIGGSRPAADVTGICVVVGYLAGIGVALAWRRRWLFQLAGNTATHPGRPVVIEPTPAQAWTPPPPPPPPAPPTPVRVDLNTADVAEVMTLPGMTIDVARRIVAARVGGGGFDDPVDVIVAADVPPHVYVGFRDHVRVSPRTDPTPTPVPGTVSPPRVTDRSTTTRTGRRLEF